MTDFALEIRDETGFGFGSDPDVGIERTAT